MKRIFVACTVIVLMALPLPAPSKARLVAIFPLRSTAEIAGQSETIVKAITAKIEATDGFEARLLPKPTGSFGDAAGSVGAEVYIVGQLLSVGDAYRLTVSSFSVATDKQIAQQVYDLKTADLPVTFDEKALFNAAPSAAPTASGLTATSLKTGVSSQFSTAAWDGGDVGKGRQTTVAANFNFRAPDCKLAVSSRLLVFGESMDSFWTGKASDLDPQSITAVPGIDPNLYAGIFVGNWKFGTENPTWTLYAAEKSGAPQFGYNGFAVAGLLSQFQHRINFALGVDPAPLISAIKDLIAQCSAT